MRSLLLLEMIVERNNIEKSGETHVVSRKTAVSDSLINYLIAATLDGMSWNDELEISRELIVLIKHQLGALNSKVETELDTHKNKINATWIAAQILVAGKTPTYRMIGRAFGVQASTVMRWFPDGNFMSEAKKLVPVVRDLLPGMKKRARELKLARKLTEGD